MKTSGQNPPVPPPGGDTWDDFSGLPEDAPTRVVPAAPQPKKAAGTVPTSAKGTSKPIQEMTSDIPVQVVCVLGKKNVTVGDLIKMKEGEVIDLDRFPHDAVDLVVNGKLMAKGELVEIDGKLGVRIVKLIEPS